MLDEFKKFLFAVEKNPNIMKMIPGRISRQQKWSSEQRFKVSYDTPSGIKCIMSKWATAQELFIICASENNESIKEFLKKTLIDFPKILLSGKKRGKIKVKR